jgi:hypothetical protein
MNRRAFLGAIAAVAAAPVAALATKFVEYPQMLRRTHPIWGEYFQTPCGNAITALRNVGDRLFAFTQNAAYEVRLA